MSVQHFNVHTFSSLFLVLLLVSVSDLLQGGANLTLVACIAYSMLLQFCVTQCSNLKKKKTFLLEELLRLHLLLAWLKRVTKDNVLPCSLANLPPEVELFLGCFERGSGFNVKRSRVS